MKRQVLEIIDNAPSGHFDPKLQKQLPEVKRRIGKLADRIDELGLVDEATGEVFVDEHSLRKLLRAASSRSENAVIDRLREYPDHKLVRGKSGLKRIPWETLAERIEPAEHWADSDANRRLSPYSSLKEVRQEVARQSTEIPGTAFEGETLYRQLSAVVDAPGDDTSEEPHATARLTFWDCIVRKLGWFMATMVVVIAAVVVVVVGVVAIAFPAVPALTAAWWPLFWSSFWVLAPSSIGAGNTIATLILVIACVVNPAG